MRVKVHPHKNLINSGVEACVSVTPMKRHGRAYYMGTVMLSDVSFVVHESGVARAAKEGQRNVHAWVTGEVIHEAVEQLPPTDKVLNRMQTVKYDLDTGRFLAGDTDVTEDKFSAAYICGPDLYVAKE